MARFGKGPELLIPVVEPSDVLLLPKAAKAAVETAGISASFDYSILPFCPNTWPA
jgi:hypothetical protein